MKQVIIVIVRFKFTFGNRTYKLRMATESKSANYSSMFDLSDIEPRLSLKSKIQGSF